MHIMEKNERKMNYNIYNITYLILFCLCIWFFSFKISEKNDSAAYSLPSTKSRKGETKRAVALCGSKFDNHSYDSCCVDASRQSAVVTCSRTRDLGTLMAHARRNERIASTARDNSKSFRSRCIPEMSIAYSKLFIPLFCTDTKYMCKSTITKCNYDIGDCATFHWKAHRRSFSVCAATIARDISRWRAFSVTCFETLQEVNNETDPVRDQGITSVRGEVREQT